MYRKTGPDTYYFDAKIPLADFCEVMGIDEDELGDIGDVETLAGLILDMKGDFPQPKESFKKYGMKFLVLKMERHRIQKVKVTKLPISGPHDYSPKKHNQDSGDKNEV